MHISLQLVLILLVKFIHLDHIWCLASSENAQLMYQQQSSNGRLAQANNAFYHPQSTGRIKESKPPVKSSMTHLSKTGQSNSLSSSLIVRQGSGEEYVVVVDCGSSGSRVQIYHWPKGTRNSALADQIQTTRDPATNRPLSMQIRPGLSSVRDDPDSASDYLVPIMKFASDNVPKEQHKDTPVYILGTAGLRSLTISERNNILEDVMRDLKTQFQFEFIVADVISGSEEGFFQWLSVNLLAKRLGNEFNQIQGLSFYFQKPATKRYGLIEMGGVSAQVAFEVTPAMDELIKRNLFFRPDALSAFKSLCLEVNLSDNQDPEQNRRVFSVSFLGFGSDNARSLATDLLVRDAMIQLGRFGFRRPIIYQPDSTLVVLDPCLPRNSETFMIKPADLMYSPKKTIGYTARPSDQKIMVRLVGQGNFRQCEALVQRLLVTSIKEKTTCMQLDSHSICDNPLIGTNFIPWQQLQFLGLGDLFYTTKMFGASGHFNGFIHRQKAAELCSKTIEQMDEIYPASDDFGRTRNMLECFKATWILGWLSTVLRMPLNGSVDLKTTDRVMQENIDWKLGAIVAKTIGYKMVDPST